jgi:hypothetical protein
MTSPQRALFFASVAFLIGVGLVGVGASMGISRAPMMSGDDMGTSGQSYGADELPSATSSLH